MKHLAIATFILGIFVTAAHAQAQKPVIFNGMVFDAPPGRDMPTLVEIEDQSGRAIDIGEWRARPDGYWELVIPIRQG